MSTIRGSIAEQIERIKHLIVTTHPDMGNKKPKPNPKPPKKEKSNVSQR